MGVIIKLLETPNELDPILNKAFKRMLDTDRARYQRAVEKLREIRNFDKVKRELSKRKGA